MAVAEEMIHDLTELVSLPEVSIRVSQMVNEEDCTAADVGNVISQDAALAARLLKIANSPFYGLSSKVDTISRAVTILGLKQIRDLVLTTSATRAFDGIPTDLVSVEDFWHHSLYCGLLAQELGDICSKSRSESLFIAGLLHDIGQLIMFHKLPQQMHAALLRTIQGEPTLEMYQAEREIIGFDHSQVGDELAKAWNLPKNLQECIAYHHEPQNAGMFPVQVALVHIANAIASLPFMEYSEITEALEVEPVCWELTGLSPESIQPAIEKARQQIAETESLFFT